jgi:ABC-type uncharacterized transport system ATPase component
MITPALTKLDEKISHITKPIQSHLGASALKGFLVGLFFSITFIFVIIFFNSNKNISGNPGIAIFSAALIVLAVVYIIIKIAHFTDENSGVALQSKVLKRLNYFLNDKNTDSVSKLKLFNFLNIIKKITSDNFNIKSEMVILSMFATTMFSLILFNLFYGIVGDFFRGNKIMFENPTKSLIITLVGLFLLILGIMTSFKNDTAFYKKQHLLSRVDAINNGYSQNGNMALSLGSFEYFLIKLLNEIKNIHKMIIKNSNKRKLFIAICVFVGLFLTLLGAFCNDYTKNTIGNNPWFGCIPSNLTASLIFCSVFLFTLNVQNGLNTIKTLIKEYDVQIKDKLPAGDRKLPKLYGKQVQMFVDIRNPYTGAETKATFRSGSGVTLVTGENGVGKSTSMKQITGVSGFGQGEVTFRTDTGDIDAAELRRGQVGKMICTQPQRSDLSALTIRQILALYGVRNAERQAFVLNELNRYVMEFFPNNERMIFNMEDIFGSHELSGGEAQVWKTMLAMLASSSEHKFMVLDEVTQNLSPRMIEKIMEFISMMICRNRMHCIMITHVDIEHMRGFFPRSLPVRVLTIRRNLPAQIREIKGKIKEF